MNLEWVSYCLERKWLPTTVRGQLFCKFWDRKLYKIKQFLQKNQTLLLFYLYSWFFFFRCVLLFLFYFYSNPLCGHNSKKKIDLRFFGDSKPPIPIKGFMAICFGIFFEDFSPSAKYPVRLMFGNRKDIGQIGLIKLSVVQVKKIFCVKNFFLSGKNFFAWKKFLEWKKFSCLIGSYWSLVKIFTIYLNKNYILPKTSETNAGSVQIKIGSSRPSTRTLITP